mmetsp:Transcript_13180/g.19216  ORF Transcript_13180/g.19216 Transcript_13180/m.19216 type:complete len:285 (-) Transcript_13180:511-1365(-)
MIKLSCLQDVRSTLNKWNKVVIIATNPSTTTTQKLERVPQNLNKLIHLLLGIVKIQTSPGRMRIPQSSVQGLTTMMSRSNRHTLHIQKRTQIARMHIVAHERNDRRPIHTDPRTQNRNSLHVAHALHEILRQFLLVLVHARHPPHLLRIQIINGGTKSNRLGNCRRPRLEPGGRLGIRRAIHVHLIDHLSSAHVRWHIVQDVLVPPKESNARRSTHFMSGCHDEIDVELLDVDGHVWDGLTRVEDDLDGWMGDGTGECDNVIDGVDARHDIGDVLNADDFGVGG